MGGTPVVGGAPEACFNGFDVFELRHAGFGSRYVAVVPTRPAISLRKIRGTIAFAWFGAIKITRVGFYVE